MKFIPHQLARSSAVIFLCVLAVGLASCGIGAPVFAPTATPTLTIGVTAAPQPTADSQPPFNPANGTATPDLTPIVMPTFAPNDPNLPVSNGDPITPKSQSNRTQIQGRITDESGKPIARARITIPKSSVPVPEIAYLSDTDGNYKISVPHGEFTLAVFADGFATAEKTLDTKQEAAIELDWTLLR